MIRYLLNASRPTKRLLTACYDFIAIPTAVYLALALRYGVWNPQISHETAIAVLATTIISLGVFVKIGLYRAVVRFMTGKAFTTLAVGISISGILLTSTSFLAHANLPRSSIIIYFFTAFALLGTPRLFIRSLVSQMSKAQCEPVLSGRYLCEAIGSRTKSILGASLIYNSLDSRLRPTRGENITAGVDFAGLGGSVRYLRASVKGSKYFNLGSNFIFSLSAEGGAIKGLKDRGEGLDNVLLTDRFFLGEPQIRGFDIRGVGPRVVRQFYEADEDGNQVLIPLGDRRNQEDALGGRAYYLGRAELEIPLGSGAREMGIRPSIFADIGAVFNVQRPTLTQSPPPGLFIPQLDGNGNATYTQVDAASINDAGACVASSTSIVTNPINPNPPACLASNENSARGQQFPAWRETYYGDTPKPRISVGIGVNWNSPFGPFRIDLAHTLMKVEGDETKTFSFNVGTQF